MEKMSQTEQRKMLKALNKAADYTKDGLSPDLALTKVSKEYKLNAPRIERLCEAYNKANAVAYMKSAPEDERANNYPIAKIANVIENMYGTVEKVAEELSFSGRNYAEEGTIIDEPMSKTASERTVRNHIDPGSIAASLEICQGMLEKIAYIAKEKKVKAERAVKNGLNDFTSIIQRIPDTATGRTKLHKMAQNLSDAMGEEDAHIVINATNANIDDNRRYMECLNKEAKAVILPDERCYKVAKKLVSDRKEMIKLQKYAIDAAEVANESVGLLTNNPFSNILNTLPNIVKAPEAPHIDTGTGMTGEWDAYAKDLKSRRMLYDMMLNDPEVNSYNPRDVQQNYNEIVETFPELAEKRQILRAVLRKSLAQGGNMDIYEIKDLLSAGKDQLSRGKTVTDTKEKMSDILSKDVGSSDDNIIQNISIPIGSAGE